MDISTLTYIWLVALVKVAQNLKRHMWESLDIPFFQLIYTIYVTIPNLLCFKIRLNPSEYATFCRERDRFFFHRVFARAGVSSGRAQAGAAPRNPDSNGGKARPETTTTDPAKAADTPREGSQLPSAECRDIITATIITHDSDDDNALNESWVEGEETASGSAVAPKGSIHIWRRKIFLFIPCKFITVVWSYSDTNTIFTDILVTLTVLSIPITYIY